LNELVDVLLPSVFRETYADFDLSDYKSYAQAGYGRLDNLDSAILQAVTALLMDPNFLYRNEVGVKVNSTDNMTQFYVTGLNGLKKGEHICPSKAKHASEGILTAMRAIGY